MATQNEYDIDVVKIVDGDTVNVDIYLGFGVCLKNERVRIVGIDTPESRTSDDVEKLFGRAAKKRLIELLQNGATLVTTENNSGDDTRGKFGRVLGDFRVKTLNRLVTDILIEEGYGVAYFGGSKSTIRQQHLNNRERLLREGVVDMAMYVSKGGNPVIVSS